MTTLSVRVEVDVDDRFVNLDTLRSDLASRARRAIEASPHVTSVAHAATVLRKTNR